MADKEQELEQNKQEKPVSFIAMVVTIGFVGGILWSSLAYFAFVFNFTDISPNVIIEPWTLGDWKKEWLGTVFSIILIGVISIGVALLYYATLRKFGSMWVGIGFGIVLFLLVFFVLNPMFPGIKPFTELTKVTLITTLCFYILYGVFVGFSISFEENEVRERKKSSDNPAS